MNATCSFHPDRKALSTCHGCQKFFCAKCLMEGAEYYYCTQAYCQAEMKLKLDELADSNADSQNESVALVTVGVFSQTYQAEIARAHLEAEGIPAFLTNEFTVSINWLWSNALGGVKLQVAEPHAEAAREILAEDLSEDLQDEFPPEDSDAT